MTNRHDDTFLTRSLFLSLSQYFTKPHVFLSLYIFHFHGFFISSVFRQTWCQPSPGRSPFLRCPPHSKAPQEPETTKFWIRSLWKEKSVLELDTWHQMALWIRITLIPPPTLWSFHQWRPRFVPRQHQVLDQGIYTWKITYINWYTVIYTWRRNKIFTNHEDVTIQLIIYSEGREYEYVHRLLHWELAMLLPSTCW